MVLLQRLLQLKKQQAVKEQRQQAAKEHKQETVKEQRQARVNESERPLNASRPHKRELMARVQLKGGQIVMAKVSQHRLPSTTHSHMCTTLILIPLQLFCYLRVRHHKLLC